MKTYISKINLALGLLAVMVISAAAEMSSNNYTLTTTVISGGGGTMGSGSFESNSTVGQPSPLMDSTDLPYSDSYDLFPGFWYAVTNIGLMCPGDSDQDKDIDGKDLAEYIYNAGIITLGQFAENFGKINCVF